MIETIPYAKRHMTNEKTSIAICPKCDLALVLRDRKDFESFTGVEYQDHYEMMHNGQAL